VSVSRSIFPIISDIDRRFFALRGEDSRDQIGVIDGLQSTFGRTYAAEPDVLIEQLAQDEALHAADTVMLTIPRPPRAVLKAWRMWRLKSTPSWLGMVSMTVAAA